MFSSGLDTYGLCSSLDINRLQLRRQLVVFPRVRTISLKTFGFNYGGFSLLEGRILGPLLSAGSTTPPRTSTRYLIASAVYLAAALTFVTRLQREKRLGIWRWRLKPPGIKEK